MTEEKQQRMQKAYMELQGIEQQMGQIQGQLQVVDQQVIELQNTKVAVQDLKHADISSNLWAPISQGIFVQAELKDNKKLLVNVGSDILVKKKISETKELLDSQIEEIQKAHTHLLETMQQLSTQGQAIQKELLENV